MATNGPVYALNLFDIVDREEYLAYSKRSAREVAAHGGKLAALGRFREAQKGDITPRQVLILVEWDEVTPVLGQMDRRCEPEIFRIPESIPERPAPKCT